MRSTRITGLVMGCAAIFTLAQPAYALDAHALAERLSLVAARAGYNIEIADVKGKGDRVQLNGVSIAPRGLQSLPDAAISLRLSNIAENDDGSYMIGSIVGPKLDLLLDEASQASIAVAGFSVQNMFLPAPEQIDALSQQQLFGSIDIGKVAFSLGGKEAWSFVGLSLINDYSPAQGMRDLSEVNSILAIQRLSIDTASWIAADPQTGGFVSLLGQERIEVGLVQLQRWDVAEGRVVVESLDLNLKDLGLFTLRLDVSGLTMAVLDQAYAAELQAQAANPPMFSPLGMAEMITINSVSLRYDDTSLVGPLLARLADALGIDQAQYLDALKAGLSDSIAGLGVPGLAEILSEPLKQFFNNPDNIELTIAPPEPKTLAELLAATTQPDGLVQVLGLSVMANQSP